MKLYGITAGLALTMSAALVAQAPVVPQAAGEMVEREITLTGCVVKGDSGYVLANGRVRLSGTGRELLANAEVRAAYLEGGHA